MTADTTTLLDRLHALVGLFGRGSLDLPDGALTRDTVFRLNGVAYDESLGRPAHDPLARLVGRGPGAYRFLLKALRFGLPDARVTLGALERSPLGAGCRLEGPCRLEGTLRDTQEPFAAAFGLGLAYDADGRIVAIDVALDPATVARLQAARQTEMPA